MFRVFYPRGTHEAEATSEVDWWDRTRVEYVTVTVTTTIGVTACLLHDLK